MRGLLTLMCFIVSSHLFVVGVLDDMVKNIFVVSSIDDSTHILISFDNDAVLFYCCPDCPGCLAPLNNIGWVTWAKKYSLGSFSLD